MNHRLVLAVLVFSSLAAQGAEPLVALPPSADWVTVRDPLPLPTDRSSSRAFAHRADENLLLRLLIDPSRKLEYLPAVVRELAGRLQAGGARVLEASTIEVQGIQVARLLSVEGTTKTLAFHLPGPEGDQVVSLIGASWSPAVEDEVSRAVQQAVGLRGHEGGVDVGVVLFGVMSTVFVLSVVFLVVGLRRKGRGSR